MLLLSMPEDVRLGAFIANKDLQEEHKEYPFTTGNCESGRKEGAHLLDQGCVKCREKVDPHESAICISCGQEDVGDKVLMVNEPARPEDVEDVEN
jgi:hypothetical protein